MVVKGEGTREVVKGPWACKGEVARGFARVKGP